jgi:hypothetical protein
MPITIEGMWLDTSEGCCEATFVVADSKGNILMYEQNLYYSLGRFLEYINKTFVKNKRFKWEKAVVYVTKREFVVSGTDLKGR